MPEMAKLIPPFRVTVLAAEDRELDALAAVHFGGWRWFAFPRTVNEHLTARVGLWPPDNPEWVRWMFPVDAKDITGRESLFERVSDWDRLGSPENNHGKVGPPCYHFDRTATEEITDEIGKRGLMDRFISELAALLWEEDAKLLLSERRYSSTLLFDLLTATPKQITVAGLLSIARDTE